MYLLLTGRWPNSKVTYWLTEDLLLILQSVSQLSWKVKHNNNNNNMSDNSDTFYNLPANLKSKVWKRFGFYKKEGHLDKIWAKCKVTVAQQIWKLTWWDSTEKTTRAMRSLWMLTLAMLQLAQTRTRKTTTLLLTTFSIHNSTRSSVITESIVCFIAKDLRPHRVVESDGFGDALR